MSDLPKTFKDASGRTWVLNGEGYQHDHKNGDRSYAKHFGNTPDRLSLESLWPDKTDDWDTAMSKAAEIEKEAHRMTAKKKTSQRISTLAAHYLRMDADGLTEALLENWQGVHRDIRSMAASLLSQDEVGKEKPDE